MEIGNFGDTGREYNYDSFRTIAKPPLTKAALKKTGYAYICTTKKTQLQYMAKLKAWGFKKVGTWKNPNTRNKLILWAYFPE